MPNILILDDDNHMLTSLSDVLQSSGYVVCCASSSLEALKVAETAKFKFDLVLSDVRMEGMDGLQCVQQLVSLNPKLKSIIMTGYASDDAPGRAMDAASSDYLRKPFTAEQLLQSVSRALSVGKERKGYRQLIHLVRAAAQKLGVAVKDMETSRERVFQWFYLAIRAGYVTQSVARSVWESLEAVEWERLNAEKELCLLARARELEASYEQVGAFCKVPESVGKPEGRKEGALSVREFQPFFKNIQNGQISCEQMKLAVYLRSMSPEELARSPELEQLKGKIWNKLELQA